MSSCCGSKCGCGADCKCGNGCGGGCDMNLDMHEAVTTSENFITGALLLQAAVRVRRRQSRERRLSRMYPDKDKAVTTSPTLTMGVAPFSKPSLEVAAAGAKNKGYTCGANCTCDPSETYLDMQEAVNTSETFIIGALVLQTAIRVRRRQRREHRLRGMYPNMDKAVTTSQTIITSVPPFSNKPSLEVAAAGAENGGCKCGVNCTCDRPVHLQVKI